MNKEPGPYILTDDDSGHHYVIPKAREAHWQHWLGGQEWEDGDVPVYADAVGGSLALLSFPSYDLK